MEKHNKISVKKEESKEYIELKLEVDINKGLVRLPIVVQKTSNSKKDEDMSDLYRRMGMDHLADKEDDEKTVVDVSYQWLSYRAEIACLVHIEGEMNYTDMYMENGWKFKVALTADDLLEVFNTCFDVEDEAAEYSSDMTQEEYDNEIKYLYDTIDRKDDGI